MIILYRSVTHLKVSGNRGYILILAVFAIITRDFHSNMSSINRENGPRLSIFDDYYDDDSSSDETEGEEYVFKYSLLFV